ncbi:unnamed protein product [Caenorhabditis auriculariae]|uniref:Uncharacterized protein n=1 Tax=Caenorhabditis auriculariae TaxID=2777116 RepID=A0A8S1HKX2_9PELO|nr:unnamed protein product [Caenorhabditis auriculariae]
MEERRRLAPNDDVTRTQPGMVTLNIPDEEPHVATTSNLKKSLSMTSIRNKIRDKREKFRQNQCAGIIVFLILGTACNILAYFASVWSAQLNAEVVRTAVENEHTFRFKLKKTLAEAPSKYLIGLLNFGGRVLSAIGTVMLVQVVATYFKRRRYSVLMKSAAEEADTVISDAHVGITDTAGECCLSCFQSLT